MSEPSQYELDAWMDIQAFKGRPVSLRMGELGERVSTTASEVGKRATQYVQSHPRAQEFLERGQGAAAKGRHIVGAGASAGAAAVPSGLAQRESRCSEPRAVSPGLAYRQKGSWQSTASAATMSQLCATFGAWICSRSTPCEDGQPVGCIRPVQHCLAQERDS